MKKQFKIGAKTYKILEKDYVEDLDTDTMGRVVSPLQEIRIANLWRGSPMAEANKEQTLWHEIVHAILDEMGEQDKSCDEIFVQGFSLLLHQVIDTLE